MNGYATSAASMGYPTSAAQAASGRAHLDGYSKEIANGFAKAAPRYDSMNPDRPNSSALVDLKDPIQVHLLTETALSDSKEYEILSQEEVDGLKKQCHTLTQRIESTRQHLAVQAKFRDAANSMAKLGPNAQSSSDSDAEQERLASEKHCEELAAELFHLEKQLMDPSRRLLEHTAGILQLTHKGEKKKNAQANGQPFNGIPGSPESLYTYTQGRRSMDAVMSPDLFDDAGLYRLDDIDDFRTGGPEVPLKSPVRGQQTHLNNVISETEQRMDSLTAALRDAIVKSSPSTNSNYDNIPRRDPQTMQAGDLLQLQMDYLESAVQAVRMNPSTSGASVVAAPNNTQVAERIEDLNNQLREVLIKTDPDRFPPPAPVEPDVAKQLGYLEESLGVIDVELTRAAARQSTGKIDAVLLGLWDRIQTGYAGIKRQNSERRRARAERGLEDEDDVSEDEGINTTESYTLDAFESRIEWLYSQATTLKDQKSVLKRQIKQQRELNNKSDAEKDEEMARKQEQLEESQVIASRAEKDAMDAQKMLSEALQDLEEARAGGATSSAAQAELEERNAKIDTLESKLRGMQESLSAAESGSRDTESRLADVDKSVAAMSAQLDDAERKRAAAEEAAEKLKATLEQQKANLKDKEAELAEKEGELEELQVSMAELKTEVTIARAELDGAYGTRAERAADAAAIKSSAEVVKLQNQVDKLKKELTGTVKELENVTKETIGSEKEKTELEAKLDEALSIKAHIEGEASGLREKYDAELDKARETIHQLQHDLDSEKLKATAAAGPNGRVGAGATVLSEQFRSTMRDQRKKWQDDLKEERIRSRKLEEEIVRLKKAMGPGKSPLSPRTVS